MSGASSDLSIWSGPLCGGALYHSLGYEAVFISAYGLIGLDLLFRVLMIEQKPTETEDSTQAAGVTETVPIRPQILRTSSAYGTFQPDHQARPPRETQSQVDGSPETGTVSDTKASTTSSSTRRRPAFVVLLSRPRMLVAILGSLMNSFLLTILESVLPLYTKRLFNFNSLNVGIILLFLMLSTFSAPFIGALSDKVGAKATVTAGFISLTPSFILLRLVNHNGFSQIVLLCVLLFAIGIALNLVLTPVFTEAKAAVDEVQEEQPGVFGEKPAYAMSFALMNMAYAAGSLVGPLLGSFLVERIGWQSFTLLVGIACAACIPASVYAVGGKVRSEAATLDNTAEGPI